ncbi:succinylglutamate desuccinylase/aspartoacylase family protein [Pseudodesulfovibrio sp. zrk46]|uniref:succinylglutamate desuccinylase/aspartoacylase family protein n=1 Tax=Pseudodesulfovibrio sp. zrk46 TaxID=2725288 RepID=UPI00144996DD|nr:succinylglutamate desuccinylase/aspartoacylase family protein [Pseudodesulfovibrio sp. zrk46]QJB55307.1 succinylglutamate desuccinylase/aspartoacylase family protein [Pseudodesulfovibrio sp. zrk46]
MTRASVEIAGHTVAPGQRKTIILPVPDTSLRQGTGMPVHVLHGRREGPSIFVTGAIHGDELNGIEVVRRLINLKRLKSLAGTLYAVPVVNIYGFTSNTRYLPDRRDLNRFFPGKAGGSLASELAKVLFENVVERCQYGIDLHTGSNHRHNLPHLRGNMEDEVVLGMAEAFGAPLALTVSGTEGTLRYAAEELGINILLFEAGEALRFDEFSIRAGVRGVTSVMEHLNMLTRKKGSRKRKMPMQVAHDRTWCRANASGLFRAKVKVGQRVSKGEPLGTIFDPYGAYQTILEAPKDGVVIGAQSLPTVYKGDAIMHIACFEALAKAEALVDKFSEIVMDEDVVS